MIEEHENQETSLQDLINIVERDDLPTNEFTIQDKDPMVILGKLNEVIDYLQTLQSTINSSDSKANEALQKAIQAVANAIEAVGTANTALSTANTAISTANNAVETAESAETKATTALANSQTAVSTANSANATAQEALSQVVAGQGTKVYRDTQLLTSLDIKPIEDDIAGNTTAINNEATIRANAVSALDNAKVDKVAGKQLSTEDFTTAEKIKLAGLNNYDDTQVQANLSSLNSNKADKNNANQSIVAGSVTAPTGNFSNINETLQSVNTNITTLLARGATALWSGNITSNTNNLSINSMSGYNFIMVIGNSSGGTNDSTILPMSYFVQKRQLYINLNTPNNTRGIGVTYVNDTHVDVSVTSATLLAIYGIK